MADPVKKPLTWSKSYPAYTERHEMFRVFQEVLKELIIMKPLDPLAYIRDNLPKIANQLNAPRVFLLGPNVSAQGIGRHMAQATGSHYLTLADIVETAPLAIREILAAYTHGDQIEDEFDSSFCKLLIAAIMERVRSSDCQKNGFILYGFPQNKAQALCAQQSGLLPRQVFILMPYAGDLKRSTKDFNSSNYPGRSNTTGASTNTPTTNTISNPSPASQITAHSGATSGGVGGGGTIKSDNSGRGATIESRSIGLASHQATPSPHKSSPPQPSSNHHSHSTKVDEKSGTVTKVSSDISFQDSNYSKIKEIVETYDYEICKVIPHDKWYTTKKKDIEAELLSHLVSIKPCGAPWIPRILIVGPPSSGKTTMAEMLSAKYGVVNVDFIECIRGAAMLHDDVGKLCKKFLRDLNPPLTDAVVKHILQRRLLREDCERKGWVLHGFPDTSRQLTILDTLEIPPNRVFYLACPEDVCWSRLMQKRGQVLDRKLPGAEDKVLQWVDEMNFEEFPYGKFCFRTRMDNFVDNLDAISAHFGKNMIYVDAAGKISTIFQFMDAAVLRPPVIRYPN